MNNVLYRDYRTLVDVLEDKKCINEKGVTFIENEDYEKFVSYEDLYKNARRVLYILQSKNIKPGSELVFQIDDNESFVTLFWACILGGIIPVPITVGTIDEHRLKLFKIWKILNSPYLAIDSNSYIKIESFGNKNNFDEVVHNWSDKIVFLNELENLSEFGEVAEIIEDDIALIQFSSGSTGDPKGVVVTHKNLVVNTSAVNKAFEIEDNDCALSWMPLTHDMGLIGVHIASFVAGIQQYIMPTGLFVRRPTLWMRKVSEHRATQLYSPNFGYKHYLTFFKPEQESGLDLSCVRFISNGAEPISVDLCYEFLQSLAQYGLKKNTILPSYGLAEGTIGVCLAKVGKEIVPIYLDRRSLDVGDTIKEIEADDINALSFVFIGHSIDNCFVRITDDKNNIFDDNKIGHIQIRGDNVTSRYYNNKKATSNAITKDGWLDTGDLGFMREGKLVITGRAKDIIFVNGQNFYPHDIERVAEKIDEIDLGKIAVCGIFNQEKRKEEIVAFVLFKKSEEKFIPLLLELKALIGSQLGLELASVIPVKKMPKTTSGKVQRFKLAQWYQNGEYDSVREKIEKLVLKEIKNNGQEIQEGNNERYDENESKKLEEMLLNICRKFEGFEHIGVDDNFFKVGVESLALTQFHSKIEELYPGMVEMADVFDNPSIRKVAKLISIKKLAALKYEKSEFIKQEFNQIDEIQNVIDEMETGNISMDKALEKLKLI